jgi:hypothetical protein
MAKGVGGLLGKADAALVGAATRASLAAVPKDLSKIHGRTAAAYASMARTTGAVYGKALEVIGKVGGELIQNAKTSKLEDPEWTNTKFDKKPKPIVLEEDSAQGREYVTPDAKELDPPGAMNIPGAGDAFKGPEIPSSVTSAPAYTYTDNNGNTEPITIQTTTEKLEELRKELKNVRKLGLDRKGRKAEKNRIRGVIDMIRSENVAFGAFKENMTTMLDRDLINFEASGVYGMDKMLFSRALLAGGKPVKQTDPELAAYDGARAVQGYDKSGKMVFTYVNRYGAPFKNKDGSNMTIDKSAVVSNDFFVPKSEKRPIFDGLINRDFIKKDYKYGSRNFDNVIEKGIDENITDKNTALDAYYYRFDNTSGSLSAALNNVEYDKDGVPQIKETEMSGMLVGALQGIGNKDQFDVSGDGVFDEKDYATQENYAALVKKALSGDDIQLGKSLLKAHLKNQTQVLIEEFKAQEPLPEPPKPPQDRSTESERTMRQQASNLETALKSNRPTTLQINEDMAIKIDPNKRTITETTSGGDTQTITPQKALDLLLGTPAYYNARELYGDLLKGYNEDIEMEPFRERYWYETGKTYQQAKKLYEENQRYKKFSKLP